MNIFKYGITISFIAVIFSGCGASFNNMKKLNEVALQECNNVKQGNSPWHISNIYNCENKSFFIPYQLWTGMDWDGDKNASCEHESNSSIYVNGKSGTTIKGMTDFKDPNTGIKAKIWKREKMNGSKQQYFTCNENGIGRIYDKRGNKERYFDLGRCKFPAGYNWKIEEMRECVDNSIEITNITFYDNKNLHSIEFKWFTKKTYDHKYKYVRGTGMTNAWKQ